MIIVRTFGSQIEDLADLSRIPSVEELRPTSCPGCRHPAYGSGPLLGIVGHGCYQRQVLGLVPGRSLLIHIRRYLCRGCARTVSILPDSLLPWRWYAGSVILAVLVKCLLLGCPVADLRESYGPGDRSPHWHSPARWSGALLARLWSWKSVELGGSLGIDPGERLRRLLGLLGVHARSPGDELTAASRRAIFGTAHTRLGVTLVGHAL